jgi:hypothetical protein
VLGAFDLLAPGETLVVVSDHEPPQAPAAPAGGPEGRVRMVSAGGGTGPLPHRDPRGGNASPGRSAA